MKIRPAGSFHTFAEAMEYCEDIEPTMAAVIAYAARRGRTASAGSIEVEKHGSGLDSRNGWDTHLVCINGAAAFFTDRPVSDYPWQTSFQTTV